MSHSDLLHVSNTFSMLQAFSSQPLLDLVKLAGKLESAIAAPYMYCTVLEG